MLVQLVFSFSLCGGSVVVDLIDCLQPWLDINPEAHWVRSYTDEGLVAKTSVCALFPTAMKIRNIKIRRIAYYTFGKIVAFSKTIA